MSARNKLVLIPNVEKSAHEKWTADRDLLDVPCPSRIVICGRPNAGKTSLIHNLILKAHPYYERIFLMHPALKKFDEEEDEEDEQSDDELSIPEYDNINYQPLFEFPIPKFFNNGSKKQLLIVDDVEIRTINKEQKKRLNKIISYASSHYNLTVIISSQDIYSQIPPCVLRFANFVVIWRFNDLRYTRMMLDSIGVSKKDKDQIIDEMKDYGNHEFLVVDNTLDSPHKYRRNGYIKVLTDCC